MNFEKESFGLVLRAGRERRKVSLARLVAETKVRPEVWTALEENDLSRWPTRIYARSFIRQYAQRVGLNPEELVNEFCRLFPHGDRRSDTLLSEHARLLGCRDLRRGDAPRPSPDRRAPAQTFADTGSGNTRRRREVFVAAAAIDLAVVLIVAGMLSAVAGGAAWPVLAAVSLGYHAIGTMAFGRSAGASLAAIAIERGVLTRAASMFSEWVPMRGPARQEP